MGERQQIYDLIIVGAGASGLTAAIAAAQEGCRVLVLEHKERAAEKILRTGNGRCNFTNKKQGADCYRCGNPAFLMPALAFSYQDTLAFFRQTLHLAAKERNGYYYPRSMQAAAVREALLASARRCGVTILCGIGIRRIWKENGTFLFDTKQGHFTARRCLLACGGKAAPKTGSDGTGYIYARALGHSIAEPVPALVPLIADTSESPWLIASSGVRCDARVSIYIDGRYTASDAGELQLTDYGISGIPVFQISRFASRALNDGKMVSASLDFIPELRTKGFAKLLKEFSGGDKKELKRALNGFLNQKLTEALCRFDWAGCLSDENLLASAVKHTRLCIIGTKSFDKAQVTCGGVKTEEVDPDTMESRILKGLYFAGEILDVDGICGGYNLQWAWASGMLAGKSAALTGEKT